MSACWVAGGVIGHIIYKTQYPSDDHDQVWLHLALHNVFVKLTDNYKRRTPSEGSGLQAKNNSYTYASMINGNNQPMFDSKFIISSRIS